MSSWAYLFANRERPATAARAIKVYAKRVLTLPGLLHLMLRPTVVRVRGAKIGALSVLGKARLEGRMQQLSIGDQTSLGNCEIAVFAPVTIGSRVVINDGVRLLSASHDVQDQHWRRVERPITVDDYAWIATGATVLPGVHIGRGSVGAAGAVVVRSVPAGEVHGGNPARALCKSRRADLNYNPTALLAPFEAWLGPMGELAQ